MRYVSDKACRENENTFYVLSPPTPHPRILPLMEKYVDGERPQMTV
jgi:hypothetical protein